MSAAPTTPEFSRLVALAAIPSSGQNVEIAANESERQALAHRFGLPSIEVLTCAFTLEREPQAAIRATGFLLARVTQICRVTLDEFPASIEERFTVRFVPAGTESTAIDLEAPDEIPYRSSELDLGEAAAEQLALALDPWPRKPDAPDILH